MQSYVVINGRSRRLRSIVFKWPGQRATAAEKYRMRGTLSEYLKAIGYNSGRRIMEVYLMNCDGADAAEDKLLRNHNSDEKKRSDRAVLL